MAISSSVDGGRRLLMPLKKYGKFPMLILGALFFFAIPGIYSHVLLQPPVQVVHAPAMNNKDLGATLFEQKGCEHCHRVNGHGGDLGPDLSTVGKRLKKEQIEHQIHDGGAAMPAFGDILQPDEIRDLVDFLHTKRKVPKKVLPTAKPSKPGAT
jgi:mono/diheme cytochrome c family protein